MRLHASRLAPCVVGWLILGSWSTALADTPAISFNRGIRPILSENCLRCHGPDAAERQGNLRFDIESSAKSPADSGNTAIVPGNVDQSELIARLMTDDADLKMPPPETGKKLTSEEVTLLREWIKVGAPWEGHWSFLPITRPSPPVSESSKHPIDAFVERQRQRHELAAAPSADRVTLIRRLQFDLTGLPPSAEEVDHFVASNDPLAYEQLVDRLLDSPHFGERLAIFWLDLVRYADSVGYHGDQPVSVSPYRDYVIRSFNENKRFDQFTIEQLAGDLLPDATTEQRIASGYNRLGMMSAEGGVQDKEYRSKYAAERVRNIGGAFLGVTLGCCECHDHKYDPITTREFYRLEAFFADITELGLYSAGNWGPNIPVPTFDQQVELASLDAEISTVKGTLDTPTPELEAARRDWEVSVVGVKEWKPLRPIRVEAKNGTTLKVQEDLSVLASGTAPDTETYTVTVALPAEAISAVRIEALPDPSLPANGPGRAGNGNFVLTEVTATYRREPAGTAQPIIFDLATASVEQVQAADKNPYKAWNAASVIDADAKGPTWGWGILPEVGTAHEIVLQTVLDVLPAADGTLTVVMQQNLDNPAHTLGRFRISVAGGARPMKAFAAGLPKEIRDLLRIPEENRSTEQKSTLATYYRQIAPALAPLRERLANLEVERKKLVDGMVTTLVTVSTQPRPIRVLARGNWMDESGDVVQPGVPGVFSSELPANRRLTRLDLARWLVSPSNPLTARTLVNRLWNQFFGAGLSGKLDDLGSQGEAPSHPELLDWLAGELIDSGWDLKHVIKTMVMSSTYQLSSELTPETYERDPFNRWLARQGRFRLDAEFVRDNALAVGGLLNTAVGGASVKPYQPPGYWSYLNFPQREWQNGQGPELYRRSLYTHWQRQYLHPGLMAFDAPSREECTAFRVRSNTPLQALVLLNDPTYVEAARKLAEAALQNGGANDEDRLAWIFRRVLSRDARPQEREVLLQLLAKHREEYADDEKSAADLLGVGAAPVDQGLDARELAGWTSITRAVLNSHAFIIRK